MNIHGNLIIGFYMRIRGPLSRVRILKFQISNFKFSTLLFLLSLLPFGVTASQSDAAFANGTEAYRAGDYAQAAKAFRESATLQPAAGTLQNLGNAEWQRGRTGPAVLAWEQSLWLDPFTQPAHGNLRFARKTAQIETPELTWYEVVSSWLPANWWAWIAGISFWLAVSMVMLPGILRQPKAAWHQAVAALALMLFLLSVPAHMGVYSRSRLGFVLDKDTPLRMTPTQQAQAITRLAAGEPARLQRSRGRYILLRTNRTMGWVERDQFGLISP
jgi:tetratricopeptide (TPR) repeat protein